MWRKRKHKKSLESKEKLERSSKEKKEAVFRWELVRGQGGANRARSEKDSSLCQVYYVVQQYNTGYIRS